MERLIAKYRGKLEAGGLADPRCPPLIAACDDEVVLSRRDRGAELLEEVIVRLGAAALIWGRPAEPYGAIMEHLGGSRIEKYTPKDSETRTFLHGISFVSDLEDPRLLGALSQAGCAATADGSILAVSMLGLEQAFVIYSSVCFASFVGVHSDALLAAGNGDLDEALLRLVEGCREREPAALDPSASGGLAKGPFFETAKIHDAMCRAGKMMVEQKLVDSFFGNVSYFDGSAIHVSRTGSSLDALEGDIDVCPLDGSSSAGITASSELKAHRRIAEGGRSRAVLHGHPRFSVILSLDCPTRAHCPDADRCHVACSRDRSVCGVPIVPGEIGTGPTGLCRTLPAAVERAGAAIVYGHGVFVADSSDFRGAFKRLVEIERDCQIEFERRLHQEGSK